MAVVEAEDATGPDAAGTRQPPWLVRGLGQRHGWGQDEQHCGEDSSHSNPPDLRKKRTGPAAAGSERD